MGHGGRGAWVGADRRKSVGGDTVGSSVVVFGITFVFVFGMFVLGVVLGYRWGVLMARPHPSSPSSSSVNPSVSLDPATSLQPQESATRLTGTIKWFNIEKGYGFISRDEGGSDVFFHYSGAHPDLEGWARFQWDEGDRVTFEIVDGAKGPTAVGVRKEVK